MPPEGETERAFDWDGSPPQDVAAAPQPSAPARRISPRLLVAAIGAAVVGGALAVALGGGGSSGAGQGGPVALAAAVTNREPGFRFNMTIGASVAGQSINFDASGSVNTGPPPSASMDATVSGQSLSERIVGGEVYIQSSLTGDKWLRTSLPPALGAAGSATSSTQLTSADPSQTLDYLGAAGTVTDVGSDTVGGVPTTHYHAVVDLSRYASMLPASQQSAAQQSVQNYEQATGSSTLPIDVWIDASNLVRQMQFDLSVGDQGSVSFAMTFSDYGPQPAVSAPPAGDVVAGPQAQTPSAPVQTPSAPPASSPSYGSGSSQSSI